MEDKMKEYTLAGLRTVMQEILSLKNWFRVAEESKQ